ADVDEVDVGVGEQVVEARVALDVAEVHLPAGRAEVALDAAPVAGQLLRVAAAQGRHPGPAQPLPGQVVDHAHKSPTYDPNSHHCRISFVFKSLWYCTVFLVCPFFPAFTEFLAHFLALSSLESDAFEGW